MLPAIKNVYEQEKKGISKSERVAAKEIEVPKRKNCQ